MAELVFVMPKLTATTTQITVSAFIHIAISTWDHHARDHMFHVDQLTNKWKQQLTFASCMVETCTGDCD